MYSLVQIRPDITAVLNSYPYCNGVIITGEKTYFIDPGWCDQAMEDMAKRYYPDVIINTHYHADHTLGNRIFDSAEVWIHELDALPLMFEDEYMKRMGLASMDEDYHANRYFKGGFQCSKVTRTLRSGEVLDLNGYKMKVLHTPGHTEGHISLWEEEQKILISGDVDLTGFGPWYGNPDCNISDYISSIDMLNRLDIKTLICGHMSGTDTSGQDVEDGVYTSAIHERMNQYKEKLLAREKKILSSLDDPLTADQVADKKMIYGSVPSKPYLQIYEKRMVEMHIKRLESLGQITEDEGRYIRTSA